MKKRNIFPSLSRAAMLAVLLAALAGPAQAQTGATNTPFWTGMRDAATFERSHAPVTPAAPV